MQATSHYLNQWSWLVYWRIYTLLGLSGLNRPRESTWNNNKEHPAAKDQSLYRWTKNDTMTTTNQQDDVIKWKHFPRYWPIVRGIHRSPVNSPHKGQWRRVLMFSLICARINGIVNNCKAGDLRRHRTHYGVIVMKTQQRHWEKTWGYCVGYTQLATHRLDGFKNMHCCIIPAKIKRTGTLFVGIN